MATGESPIIRKMSPLFIVADIESSLQFYIHQLGFTADSRHEDFYAGVSRDGASIHLKTGSYSLEERARRRKQENIDVVFYVTGIDALYRLFVSKGVDMVQGLREMDYGREFYIADPDGYLLGFLE